MSWPPRAADRLRTWFGGEPGHLACPLPGHSGRAEIDVSPDEGGDLRLLCCRGRSRSLGEVRAAMAYGADRLRTNIEIATWTRRLAYEAGLFAPLPVQVPALDDADEILERARAGFELLVGLRWADGARRPVAWSVRFSAAWCGLTFREAHAAITGLREAGVIVETGRVGRCRLYLPGDRRLRLIDGGRPPSEPPVASTGGSDDDLVAAIIDLFDAVEISVEPWSFPRHCAYAAHAGRGWRLASGGPWFCGICHPPARDDVITEAAA